MVELRPAFERRLAWKAKMINYLVPNLASHANKRQVLEIVNFALDEAYNDGMEDCADMVDQVANVQVGNYGKILRVMSSAIRKLIEKNKLGR